MPAVDVDFDIAAATGNQRTGLLVKFYSRVVRDEKATKEAGKPVHVNAEYVKIRIPGDKTLELDRPVTDADRRAYRMLYDAFRAEKSQEEAAGFPLREWAGIPPELAEDYIEGHGVKTVEQLAAVHDGNIGNMGGLARKYRDKAIQYLEAMGSAAPVQKIQDELQRERAAREAERAQEAARVAVLEARLKELEAAEKSRASKR